MQDVPRLSVQAVQRLDGVAVAFALLLSVGCLVRGAVDDSVIALLLLAALPMLWVAATHARAVHVPLRNMGLVWLVGLGVILCLQQLWPATGESAALWQQVRSITGVDVAATLRFDKSVWLPSMGRVLLFIIAFVIALFIGSSESSARIFLQSLLVSGTVCLGITFFVATSDGVPRSAHNFYSHGFVNANNASNYLGIMLLLALAQAIRYFRVPVQNMQKFIYDTIERLNIMMVLRGSFMVFALLIALAGLFMTGSRAGVFFSLLCCIVFGWMLMHKMNLHSQVRRWLGLACAVLLVVILIWSFTNFGQATVAKLQTDGLGSNSRFDIFAAVLPMIGDHPLLGTGLGSFPSAFQPYRPQDVSTDGIIDKAHNSYLEFAAEMGLPALLLLLALLGRIGGWLWMGVKEREEHYTIPAFGLAVWLLMALHSLIDFPLQIPAIAALCIAILTVCVSQTDPHFCHPHPAPEAPVKRRRVRKRRHRIEED